MKPYQKNIAMIVMLLAGLDGERALTQVETPALQERPNVLFILTDDQRYDALSCMGHPYLKTPHIDGLANEGLLFKNHFCTTSLCSPSRASILSGLYAHSHGVSNNFTEYPKGMVSFPMRLQDSPTDAPAYSFVPPQTRPLSQDPNQASFAGPPA